MVIFGCCRSYERACQFHLELLQQPGRLSTVTLQESCHAFDVHFLLYRARLTIASIKLHVVMVASSYVHLV